MIGVILPMSRLEEAVRALISSAVVGAPSPHPTSYPGELKFLGARTWPNYNLGPGRPMSMSAMHPSAVDD